MCWKYLLTLDLNISSRSPQMLSVWCSRKSVRHGYQFEYADEKKYCTTIPDWNGEQWKLFRVTPCHGSRGYVSSFGRSKRIYKNGKEVAYHPYCIDGYLYLSGSPSTRSVAR
eukprot:768240_1